MGDAATVLIIEDEMLIRWSLRNCLQALGMRVIEADSGEAGLMEAAQGGFDAAIVDLRLPGIDGMQVAQLLRSACPGARVWIMSAHGTPELENQARALGARGFVNKPFDFRLLAQSVRDAVTARAA